MYVISILPRHFCWIMLKAGPLLSAGLPIANILTYFAEFFQVMNWIKPGCIFDSKLAVQVELVNAFNLVHTARSQLGSFTKCALNRFFM